MEYLCQLGYLLILHQFVANKVSLCEGCLEERRNLKVSHDQTRSQSGYLDHLS